MIRVLVGAVAGRLLVEEPVRLAAPFSAARAPTLVMSAPPAAEPPPEDVAPARPARVVQPEGGRVAVAVDLGKDGEPAGVSRLLFKPARPRSVFLELSLRVPLGLLIAEEGGEILVEGTLPGYGAFNQTEPGDVVRAVTAYRDVLAGAPMWQQMMSYTPVGELKKKRLIFRTEGATYDDVREAIASHRKDAGGDGVVTLIVERAVDTATPATPRDAVPRAEPLGEVIKRDLEKKAVKDDITEAVNGLTPAERAQRLLDLGFDVDPDQ